MANTKYDYESMQRVYDVLVMSSVDLSLIFGSVSGNISKRLNLRKSTGRYLFSLAPDAPSAVRTLAPVYKKHPGLDTLIKQYYYMYKLPDEAVHVYQMAKRLGTMTEYTKIARTLNQGMTEQEVKLYGIGKAKVKTMLNYIEQQGGVDTVKKNVAYAHKVFKQAASDRRASQETSFQ